MDPHKSLFDSNGGGQKRRGGGGCCSAFRAFHVYDNRASLYPLTHGFFFLPLFPRPPKLNLAAQ